MRCATRMRLTFIATAAMVAVLATLGPTTAGTAFTRPYTVPGGWTCSIMSGPEAALVMGDPTLGGYDRVQVCTRRFDGQIEFSVTPLDLTAGNGSPASR